MGVPVTFLGSNTQAGLGSAITLSPSKRYLVIDWEDVDQAIDSTGATPDNLEDWIAAINYQLVDQTLTDTNPQTGAKITAGRRFLTQINGKGLDNGIFESGVDLVAYQITTTIYAPDPSPARPPAINL
ncbi:hypothetical protein PN437_20195 [Microcystis aeruginosa CS-564/01]|uniref:hypothetical protein n=1 Tax=Microcystis aeruginosa TaxID=1126 RepID=UPI00232B33CC|nr:hypothetical protein [Microcystis aeruginosa]MDB9427187.1 hypothetical protein [Microcystis aeruginosa CS-564/01]